MRTSEPRGSLRDGTTDAPRLPETGNIGTGTATLGDVRVEESQGIPEGERSPVHDRITLRYLARPIFAEPGGGRIELGRILHWMDNTSYACASGYCGDRAVTVSVGRTPIVGEVRPGDIIEVRAQLVGTGTSTIHLFVRVQAADAETLSFRDVASSMYTFVALNEAGRPTPVERWTPATRADEALASAAGAWIASRSEFVDNPLRERGLTSAGTTPQLEFEFFAAPTDANWSGDVHGGVILRWHSEAADALARNAFGGPVRCHSLDGMHFRRPVPTTDLVAVRARIIHSAGDRIRIATSMSSQHPRIRRPERTSHCFFEFGARDTGRAAPRIALRSDEDYDLSGMIDRILDLQRALPPLPGSEPDRRLDRTSPPDSAHQPDHSPSLD